LSIFADGVSRNRDANAAARSQGAFRGRLTALQKGGLLGAENQPGRGHALRYGPDQLHRFVFACECCPGAGARDRREDMGNPTWRKSSLTPRALPRARRVRTM
jgi:hypothetical protein